MINFKLRTLHGTRRDIKSFNESILQGDNYTKRQSVRTTPVIFFDSDFDRLPPFRWSSTNWCTIDSSLAKSLEIYRATYPVIHYDAKQLEQLLQDKEFITKAKADISNRIKELGLAYIVIKLKPLMDHDIETTFGIRNKLAVLSKQLLDEDPILFANPRMIDHISKLLKEPKAHPVTLKILPTKRAHQEIISDNVLRLKKQGTLSVRDICEECKISKYKYYSISKKAISSSGHEVRERDRPLNENSLQPDEMARIKWLLDTPYKSYTIPEICAHIKKNFNHTVTKKMVYYYVTKKLGYSFKRNHFKFPSVFRPEQKIGRYKICVELTKYLYQGMNFLCIDETGINIGINREYSFAKKGTHPYRAVRASPHTRNVMMAITQNNVFAYTIRTGAHNEHSFIDFIINLIKKLIELGPDYTSKTVLFMDNAPFHRSELGMRLLRMLPITVCFNAIAMPEYNPIEVLFSIIKRRLKREEYSKM